MKDTKLNCLIVDDTDQERKFKTDIYDQLKSKHIDVEMIYVNPLNPECITDGEINYDKLKAHILFKIKDKKIDVLATDFNFSKNENCLSSVTGLDVINIIHGERCGKVETVLYTGNRDKVLDYIIEKNSLTSKEGICTINDKVNLRKDLKNILLYNIKAFVERDGYDQEVNKILREKALSTEKMIVDKLLEYKEMVFLSGYETFKGKTLGEIANEINSKTEIGREFKSEIIELTLGHMIKLNEEE